MNVGTVLLLICAASAQLALSLRLARSKECCSDSEIDSVVGPPLRDLVNLFGARNNTLYPTAVSAIGALRYGGNSALIVNKRHIIDHDVDFLLAGAPESSWNEASLIAAFSEVLPSMRQRGWSFESQIQTPADVVTVMLDGPVIMQRFWVQHPRDLQGHEYGLHSLLIKAKPNALTERFNHSFTNRIASEVLKELLPKESAPLVSAQVAAWQPLLESLDKSDPQPDYIHFDFFHIFGPQKAYQPHATNKLLFHGVDMHYPADPTLVLSSLQMAFWDSTSSAAQLAFKGDICAFSLPGAFPDDMADNPEARRVAQMCSKALKENEYVSFTSLGC